MNLNEIESKINELFDNVSNRQIIFWYDENKEFEEEIHNLKINNAKILKLNETNWIQTKYTLEIENKKDNFLIYAPFSKPLDEDNYLADTFHYSKIFSADKIALIADELNISHEYIPILKEYPKFFNSNARINDFKKLNISPVNEENIILGFLAVLSKSNTNKLENILRSILVEFSNEKTTILDNFEKFNLLNNFWNLISDYFDYDLESKSITNLIIFLLVNYSASFFRNNLPSSWKDYETENKNNSRVFIDEFMNHNNYSENYDIISLKIQKEFNVERDINRFEGIENYKYCDTFEVFDKNIIKYYIDLLYSTKKGIEFEEFFKDRQKTHFYKKFENEYQAINYTNLFMKLIYEFESTNLSNDIDELIKQYSGKWVYIDTYYRKFYYHFDQIVDSQDFEDLRQLIENMYVNSFLDVINPAFSNKLTLLNSINDIDIKKQWKFYKNKINKLVEKEKVAVIISDAFRYGCAVELMDELNKDPNRDASIQPMLSTIPSYTALGMAALLPNRKISYNHGNVLVDDKQTKTPEDRQSILKDNIEESIVIKFDKLKSMDTSKVKQLYSGCKLTYVYHDKIDSISHKDSLQHDIFNAAQRTIEDIIFLIDRLRKYGRFTNIFVTADHGFIYKRDDLKESEKVDVSSHIVDRKKRYILSNSNEDIFGAITLPMSYLNIEDMYVSVPISSNVFKSQGGGLNFVHGGASLEECIIPLIKIKADYNKTNQDRVGFQLVSSKNKISSREFKLAFFQKENISENALPFEAAISFVDENGDRISNEVLINFNVNSEYPQDREFREEFTLKQKRYSRTAEYYLLVKDYNTDVILEKIPFVIDLAFQDDFDFNLGRG